MDKLKTIIMQGIGFIPLKYRLSKQYWRVKSFASIAQWATEEEIANWQLQRLKEMVEYAYINVPAYYFLYHEYGIKPSDIRALADIKLLPFVTKEMIRDNLKDFTSKQLGRNRLCYAATGGSTGIPLGFFRTRSNGATERAFMHLNWERAGWNLGDSSAVLRGRFVGSERLFWKYDRYNRNLALSSYYLTENNYPEYVKTLLQFRPQHLQAYPSVATIFADLIISKGDVGTLDFRTVLLGSENIYDWQKERLCLAFPRARLFGWYGHSESAILASMCEYSDEYHIWPFYGLTEVYNDKDIEAEEGDVGELIGTSFWSFATPFIRYRTSDTAKVGKFGCDKCKRRFRLLESIEGRLQEVIVTKSGRYIPMTAINMHSNIFESVKQFQFLQKEPGKVVLSVVKKEHYSQQNTQTIYAELKKKLGDDFELELAFVDAIPRTSRGKYRFLKQELEIKYGD